MRLSCTIYSAITLILFSNIVLYASGTPERSPMWNQTWTDRLKADLFVKYDKFARPTQHFNSTVVDFDITILYIDVDDFRSTVTVNGWTYHQWTDDKLKWDPAKYGNIQHIHVGNHEVWQPDVLLYHSGTAGTVEHYGDTSCIISHDGQVLWVPPSQFIGLCDLDMRLWPFDTQICTLTFGSWTYHGEQIDLRLGKTQEMEMRFVKNAEWTLLDLAKKREAVTYSCCPDPYINLKFTMTLKRNSALYCSILLMPATAIVFLVLVTFWLPPQSETKISVAACTVLIIAVFLAYFGVKVPLTTNPPLIVYFYSGCLCLVTISLILSIIVINITKRTYCKPLPRNIRLCLLSWPGRLLGLSDLISVIESRRPVPGQELRGKLTEESTTNSTSNISDDGDRQNIISPTKNTTQLEWILAGTAINRIAFVLFCLILATMAIVYIS
ncbi:neuronal acetylcholine receptor subunit alpha-10 isoform X2 [Linepithema humile]|uniref:neuronal acetylcholine receptor subunit alpha-10 isoform X2 n=1 Tax=Linepithema humile TaxID=83485 RepID=UPI00062366CD|nr:PREDICTED: neuronal acetylcholine receptor subunit alpha-10 isoform X2 [Linepithema humile]